MLCVTIPAPGICSEAKEVAEFADVKAVCLQGSPKRAKEFAERCD